MDQSSRGLFHSPLSSGINFFRISIDYPYMLFAIDLGLHCKTNWITKFIATLSQINNGPWGMEQMISASDSIELKSVIICWGRANKIAVVWNYFHIRNKITKKQKWYSDIPWLIPEFSPNSIWSLWLVSQIVVNLHGQIFNSSSN